MAGDYRGAAGRSGATRERGSGIIRSNLDADTATITSPDDSGYSAQWLAGVIDHHVHDPYDLYEKAAAQ
ncbi:hypothetical protein [Mycolicibacterium hodleri]|uniref:Uncharacterized protein n=1 Tax=Mycolicibacterium hodleri TaxID=49897 RepID=A0A502EDJ2_9MYCO|nr:hypothetical protein [Mycolicibacterium hodleri]TPG34566.1 hypothetical protein EAH80_13650 [Mycolicibacterium hodleri]